MNEIYELENCVQDIYCTDSRDDEKLIENTKSRFLEIYTAGSPILYLLSNYFYSYSSKA